MTTPDDTIRQLIRDYDAQVRSRAGLTRWATEPLHRPALYCPIHRILVAAGIGALLVVALTAVGCVVVTVGAL